MHSAKRYLLAALSFALCLFVFATFAPRITHAVALLMVQVTNRSANPVPTYVADTPFQAHICSNINTANTCSVPADNFVVPTTTSTGATVIRLIVDNFSGGCLPGMTNTIAIGAALLAPPVPDFVGGTPMFHSLPTNTSGVFGAAAHFEFNAGDTVRLIPLSTITSGSTSILCEAIVDGHLITQ